MSLTARKVKTARVHVSYGKTAIYFGTALIPDLRWPAIEKSGEDVEIKMKGLGGEDRLWDSIVGGRVDLPLRSLHPSLIYS